MDIVIRAAITFVALWFVVRVTGKRQISQLSAFELILLVTLGDLVAQGVLQDDTSLTAAMLAVGTFALLSVLVSWVSWRFPRTRPALTGQPVVVVERGEVNEEVLANERMPIDDLFEAAREQGIRAITEVDLAVLEPDGTFSFFVRTRERPGAEGGTGTDVKG
jgi:uncharacterized membrane protein YcaP (DUF421 family)